jgi:polysaccharide export outer membrane protein
MSAATLATACSSYAPAPDNLGGGAGTGAPSPYDYLIGPGDRLQLFVWKTPELTTTTVVRPDGKISLPLVEDIQAAGKTPTTLSREIHDRLAKYIQDPVVTIMPTSFVGQFAQQVRVIGEAAKPSALSYRSEMTVLDVMIEVGGLTDFAAGNRAEIVRKVDSRPVSFRVRLDSLVRDGDVSANVPMLPGDILIIPESWF